MIITGGSVAFDSLLYGEDNQYVKSYLDQQISNISQLYGQAGTRIIDRTQQLYDIVNTSRVKEIGRRALDLAAGMFRPNNIYECKTSHEVMTARPVMQKWIMANPKVRDLYNQGQCCGYGETYQPLLKEASGSSDVYYRRTMSGIISDSEEGPMATIYVEDGRIDEVIPELIFRDQFSILKSWRIAELMMNEGNDPTDPYGGKL